MITKISELKKTSTKWRIVVRVTYKTDLLAWKTFKSHGTFFTADFIDALVCSLSSFLPLSFILVLINLLLIGWEDSRYCF